MATEVTRRIETEAEYEAVLDEIERFFDTEPVPGTPEAERFDVLAQAIEAHEAEHWVVEGAAPPAGRTKRVGDPPAKTGSRPMKMWRAHSRRSVRDRRTAAPRVPT